MIIFLRESLVKDLVDDGGHVRHIDFAVSVDVGGRGLRFAAENHINDKGHIAHIHLSIAV